MKLKKIGILLFIFLISFSFAGCQKEEEYTNEKNMEAVEKYPQLIKVEKQLKKQFPFPKEDTDCIRLSVPEDYIFVDLFFKETVTKKQMVDAIQYTMKEIRSFSSDEFIISSKVSYTEEEKHTADIKGFMRVFCAEGAEGGSWEIYTSSNERKKFDPDAVEEGQAVDYFQE